ncbi:E3 ubiquitin-protein ligase MARCHF3 isoform 2-T2 [Ara ararauna]
MDGDRLPTTMRTNHSRHLPGVPPEHLHSPAPTSKTLPRASGSGCQQHVMPVSAKGAQLLSSVMRTLATQRRDTLNKNTEVPATISQQLGVPTAEQSSQAAHVSQLLICDMQRERVDHNNFPSSFSSPFNDQAICRICHEGSSQEDLLSPCKCTGTLGTIHRSCLERWLTSSNTSYCELCQFRFAVERKHRPLVEWLKNPGPQHEKRTLFGDLLCFFFITPLASISGWLCLRGAVNHLHFSSRLEAVGLIALTVALFTIYLFWTLVSFRYHCKLYSEWRRTNQRVILLLPNSANIPSNQQSLLGLQSIKRNSKETIV